MSNYLVQSLDRRDFIRKACLAGTALYLGMGENYGLAATEPPPETTRLRLRVWRPACWAPFHVAESLLRKEGFTDIQYLTGPGPKTIEMFREGALDLSPSFAALDMHQVEEHQHPIVFLSGACRMLCPRRQ
jgi:NitT/TauT family transport system substrate-binding protein